MKLIKLKSLCFWEQGQNNKIIFFFSCALTEKNEACFLTLYHDVLIFPLLKDPKND